MRSIARISAILLTLALAQALPAQAQAVKIFGLMELSGTGATSGTNFNDGVKLAVKEINASGGILGRKIESAPATPNRSRKSRKRWRSRRSTTAPTS